MKASKKFLFFLLLISLTGCGTINGHIWFFRPDNNQNIYGTIRVAYSADIYDPSDTWSSDNINVIRNAITEASRFGSTFVLTDIGSADLVIYKATIDRCQADGAGYFIPNTRFISVDPRCTISDLELQTTIEHELGHFLGMQHICMDSESTDCAPHLHGAAVMNPYLEYQSRRSIYSMPQYQVTELDIQEFLRAWNRRNRLPYGN